MHDQHVLILGLGASGLAMARWCVRQGARVTVADTREQPPQLAALRTDCPPATFVSGAFDDALMARGDWTLIARSPGLAPASLQTVLTWAQAHRVAVLGELGLFARALKALADYAIARHYPELADAPRKCLAFFRAVADRLNGLDLLAGFDSA